MTTATPVTLSLLARLEARPGKEAEVEALLRSAVARAAEEPLTVHWFVLRIAPSTFVVLTTFADPAGPAAHFTSAIAADLKAKAHDLLAGPPVMEHPDVIAYSA